MTEIAGWHIGGQVEGFPGLVAGLFAEGRQVHGIERSPITFENAPDRAHWRAEIVFTKGAMQAS